MHSNEKFLFIYLKCLLYLTMIPLCTGLECYVCVNQENNLDKCVKTIMTCDVMDDRCFSEVRWGSTPYWAPTGEKQFYITKSCATKAKCDSALRNVSKRCDRIWYNDWECAECCFGDRCNYYVTLSGNAVETSVISIVFALLSPLIFRIFT